MARIEGEVVLAEFARRYEKVTLGGAPVPHLSNTIRGLDSLPLAVTQSRVAAG
jgi:cytochrome P450